MGSRQARRPLKFDTERVWTFTIYQNLVRDSIASRGIALVSTMFVGWPRGMTPRRQQTYAGCMRLLQMGRGGLPLTLTVDMKSDSPALCALREANQSAAQMDLSTYKLHAFKTWDMADILDGQPFQVTACAAIGVAGFLLRFT